MANFHRAGGGLPWAEYGRVCSWVVGHLWRINAWQHALDALLIPPRLRLRLRCVRWSRWQRVDHLAGAGIVQLRSCLMLNCSGIALQTLNMSLQPVVLELQLLHLLLQSLGLLALARERGQSVMTEDHPVAHNYDQRPDGERGHATTPNRRATVHSSHSGRVHVRLRVVLHHSHAKLSSPLKYRALKRVTVTGRAPRNHTCLYLVCQAHSTLPQTICIPPRSRCPAVAPIVLFRTERFVILS